MHFDFIDLRLLAAVLETGSITAGAERVGLSLAAASARMRGLEQQAGVALLTRNPRGVQATPAGERLLQHARVLLQQRDRLRARWPSSRRASAASCASSPIPSPPTLFCRSCWRIFWCCTRTPTSRWRSCPVRSSRRRLPNRRRISASWRITPICAGWQAILFGRIVWCWRCRRGMRSAAAARSASQTPCLLSLSACRKRARCNSIWNGWRYAAAARCGYGRAPLISTPSAAWCGAAPGWRWCRKRVPNAIRRSDTAPCR